MMRIALSVAALALLSLGWGYGMGTAAQVDGWSEPRLLVTVFAGLLAACYLATVAIRRR